MSSDPEPKPQLKRENGDFTILYSALNDPDYTDSINSLNSSDNWLYYNPHKNPNFYYALFTRTQVGGDKLVVLKIDKNNETVTKCVSTTQPDTIYWNDALNSKSIWLDIKVIYTQQGDYAYMCTEGDDFGSSKSSFNNRVVHIYKLDTLYVDDTYSCINTIPAISYHNLQVFQNNDCAYLYGVGGNRNALEIYDLSINPEKPFYLGGYIAYPEGYNHSHEGSNENSGKLYIHDMQVSDQISGQNGKIIGFLACIYNSTIVVVDLSDPLDVTNIIIIDDPRFKQFTQYGLHHCWLTPNNEFLLAATENKSNKTFVIDVKSIIDDNVTELLGIDYTKYIGQFQVLTSDLGTNLHNQYCYKIKGDNEHFILLTAAYKSGTHIHKINYQKIRDGLLQISEDNLTDNLQDCLSEHLRLKEDYESNESLNGFHGVWSASYCPNSKFVFDSCFYHESYAKGFRVFKANVMPEVEDDRQVPALYNQITNYGKKLILSGDPLSPTHPGFFRAIIRNPETGYKYVILAYDNQNNLIKNGLLYGKCQFDLGHFSNSADTDKVYTITVKEFDENNTETSWSDSQDITVKQHMYMPMNEYTDYNKDRFNLMHSPINMPNGYDISFTYTIEKLTNPFTKSDGYKINLSMLSNLYSEISFEELSLYNDPGWTNNSSPVGIFSSH